MPPGSRAGRRATAYHPARKDRITDTHRSQLLRHPARFASASLLRLQSDDRLASLAVDGHEAAFAAIVDRYRAPLLRYCSGIVGPARAEDAVQQSLISAHEALMRTTEVRHLRSWLYRIAHNTSLNVLRAVRDDVPLEPAHALADGPEAAYERAERLRETLAAVGALPERQRAALLLRELEGRSHEEIATALGVTTGSARQSLMRARTAVRGAVTAVTPYPLIAKLASALHASGHAASSWGEAAAGAGATVTLAKLTAGVMATGAIVGGAVGADRVVHPHRHATSEARAAVKAPAGAEPTRAPAAATQSVVAAAATTATRTIARAGDRSHHGSSDGQHGSTAAKPGAGSGHDGREDGARRADGDRGGTTRRGSRHSGARRQKSGKGRHTRGAAPGSGHRAASADPGAATARPSGGDDRSGGSSAPEDTESTTATTPTSADATQSNSGKGKERDRLAAAVTTSATAASPSGGD